MAGKISVNQVQLGDSGTATNNFVWQTNVDGTCKLARGNVGATTQDILTVDSNGIVAAPAGRNFLTLGTAQNTTAGTSIAFTDIPAWANRITIIFSGVSLSATANFLVQVGSGSYTTSGYAAIGATVDGTVSNSSYTSGFGIRNGTATNASSGHMILTRTAGNNWVSSHSLVGGAATPQSYLGAGQLNLSGTLDRLRVSTTTGTDTFDAGSMNILIEG